MVRLKMKRRLETEGERGEYTRDGEGLHLPIHRLRHLLLVIRDWPVDIIQLFPNLGAKVPPQAAADDAGSQVIHAILRVANHDRKVLGHIVQKHVKRMHGLDDGFVFQNAVMEDVRVLLVGIGEGEIVRIPRAEELKGHLHDLLTFEFGAGQVL